MFRARCRARVLTWGLFVGAAAAVLAPVGPGAFVPLKLAVAAADSVGNDVYVAVVVDFGNGSSIASISKCVPVPSTDNDADALAAVVGQANVAYASSGLLCAIDNYPANGVQNCGQSIGSGDYNYWSYWHGASGSWVYANNGPAEQSVSNPGNDVEGWRFQVGQPDNSSDPPPAVPASYAQICNASTEVPPSQQPPPAVTTTTTLSATSPQPPVTTTTSGRTSTGPHQAAATTTAPPRPGSGSATKATGTSTTTTSRSGTAAATGGSGGQHATSGTHPASVAAAPSHHDAGGGGTPFLPVILVVAAVAALGGVAFFRWRRRPAEE
jgi:hypothetical protein